CQQHYDSPPTF
nr:immunoglobulin light chain junction region [Macaca mulatta]